MPEVLKWNVIIASASLNENEKLHFKFVLPNSDNVAKNGTGGLSIIGVIYPAPIYIIGNVPVVSIFNTSSLAFAPKKSLTFISGNLTSKWKFFYNNNEINGLSYLR